MKRPIANPAMASSASAAGRKILGSEKVKGRNFVIYESSSPLEVRIDGVVGMSLGPVLSRIDFFTVERVEAGAGFEGEPLEHRVASSTLSIPTTALLEFLVGAADGLRANEKGITTMMDELSVNYRTMVAKLGGAK